MYTPEEFPIMSTRTHPENFSSIKCYWMQIRVPRWIFMVYVPFPGPSSQPISPVISPSNAAACRLAGQGNDLIISKGIQWPKQMIISLLI